MHEIAREYAVSIVDLDRPELQEAVAADPAAFVAGSAPVCIDEFQKVPIVPFRRGAHRSGSNGGRRSIVMAWIVFTAA